LKFRLQFCCCSNDFSSINHKILHISRSEMENCRDTRSLMYRCDHTKNHSLIQDYDSKCFGMREWALFQNLRKQVFLLILSQKSGHPRREKCVIFSSLNQLIIRVFNKYPYIGGNSKTQTLDGIFEFPLHPWIKIRKFPHG